MSITESEEPICAELDEDVISIAEIRERFAISTELNLGCLKGHSQSLQGFLVLMLQLITNKSLTLRNLQR